MSQTDQFRKAHLTYCMLYDLELVKRDVPGFAIGGLSGGEEKSFFWKMVTLSTDHLPRDKPRYLMGVGFVYCLPYLFMAILLFQNGSLYNVIV